MSAAPEWQPSLLDGVEETSIDGSFASLTRVDLDPESWVDYAPGWVTGSDELFQELLENVAWGQRTRPMFEKRVL